MRALSITLAAILIATPANCQEWPTWREQRRPQPLYDYHGPPRYVPANAGRYWRAPSVKKTRVVTKTRYVVEHEPICRPWRRVVGEEGKSKAQAERLAENRWLGEIGYIYGVQYANLNNARHATRDCNPSTITRWIGKVYWRCAIEGRPCRNEDGKPLTAHRFKEGDGGPDDERD